MSDCYFHLPADPTPREIARLRILAREFSSCQINLIGPERVGEETLESFAGTLGFTNLVTVLNAENETTAEQNFGDVIVSVSESVRIELELAGDPEIWVFCEGDPRLDTGVFESHRAQAEARQRLAMTIRRLEDSLERSPILAFADVPRRAWDSLDELQARVDTYIPQMIREAEERRINGSNASAMLEALVKKDVASRAPRTTSRIKDIKYYIHTFFRKNTWILSKNQTHFIMLHNPEPDILSDILSALNELGPFIRYSKAIQAMEDDRPLEPGFILTFDDGYKQNMTLLDVLDEYDCKAMFFLNTAPIDEMSPAWFMNPDKDFRSLKKDLKKLTYDNFLTAIDESGLTEPCSLRGRFGLTSGEVGNLLSRGHEIGVHTHNHPFLTQLQCQEMREEITQCWTHLRHILDCPSLPLHFAYPDGDCDERVVDFLEAMGVRSAVTIEPSPIREPVRLLTLPRTCMDDTDYAGYALFKLTGAYRFFHRMAKQRGTKQANHAHT